VLSSALPLVLKRCALRTYLAAGAQCTAMWCALPPTPFGKFFAFLRSPRAQPRLWRAGLVPTSWPEVLLMRGEEGGKTEHESPMKKTANLNSSPRAKRPLTAKKMQNNNDTALVAIRS